MPLPALHLRLVQAIVKIVNAPDLSLRGRFAPVAISGRHLQFVQSADKTYKPIASVAAVSDRLAGWQCLQRKFIDAMPSSLSLRGGRRPTWQSRSTRPDHRKAIGENATAFPRLPRRFAPRNDTSGSAVVYQRPPTVELPCTGRSLSSRWRLCRLTDAACPLRVMSALQGGNTYGTNSLAQCHQVCHSEERSDVGISQNPVGSHGTPGENVTAFPRLPRRPLASSQ